MPFNLNTLTFTSENYFNTSNYTEESVNYYITNTDFSNLSNVNLQDLNLAKNFLADKLNLINADLDPNNPTSKQSLLNIKNIELADVEDLVNITNQQLNSKQTELNGVLGQISEYTDDFNEIRDDLADIEAQLDARTEELSNRLQQEGVSLSTIKTTLNNFKAAQTALNQVLANPTVNLYASGTKKIIPLKKRIKLFLTLNGKEQWAAPPTVQFISISALVSSKELHSNRQVIEWYDQSLSNILELERAYLPLEIRDKVENTVFRKNNLVVKWWNDRILYSTSQFNLKYRTSDWQSINGSTPYKEIENLNGVIVGRIWLETLIKHYNRAGRWRDITKSLKPKLAREAGRYYIELDARGLADFPADYFDEFVIRYDNPAQWSGEVLRWSWGAGATVGSGAGLVQTAQQLTASMEQIVDILDELLGEGGSEG